MTILHSSEFWKRLIVPAWMLLGAWISVAFAWKSTTPTTRELVFRARQYAYEPSEIRVSSGDTLRIRLVSLDVVHGFFLEGHDLDAEIHPQQRQFLVRHPSMSGEWQEVEEVTVVAGRPGKYRYRCSHTCGTMHPFMLGEMVVEPNLPLHAGVGCLAGLFVGMMVVPFGNRRQRRREPESRG